MADKERNAVITDIESGDEHREAGAPRIYIHRLGCPKIEADHDLLSAGLSGRGAVLVESSADADTVVVSTCAFIEDSRVEAIDAILEAVRWKEAEDGRKVYVTGCMPVRYSEELRAEIPEVDGWFTFASWDRALATLMDRTAVFPSGVSTSISSHPGQIPRSLEEDLSRSRLFHSGPYAYLRIAEGCDRRCAYCAIPGMRGSYRSRPPESILGELDHLLDAGVREIVVVAQEVNSYGRDLSGSESIETLLPKMGERLARRDGERWLRVLYTHPPLFSEAFIEALASTPSLAPYLDFPVEHADNKILRAMGRGTTWEAMRGWIERLRERIPGIALRTSVIVGFPGEGEKEFETLLERLTEIRFERLGVFRYSREEGTRAWDLPGVEPSVAEQRREVLLELAEEQAEDWCGSRVGMETSMIVERLGEDGLLYGRSIWDAPEVDGSANASGEAEIGAIVRGRVVEARPYDLTLELLSGKGG